VGIPGTSLDRTAGRSARLVSSQVNLSPCGEWPGERGEVLARPFFLYTPSSGNPSSARRITGGNSMPSYHLYTCPGCEANFRVVWPNPVPAHLHLCSKIKITCPDCGETNEPYGFLLDKILQAPDPARATVQVESISPPDPNPEPYARSKFQQQIFLRRAARFKAMYGN